MLQRTHFFLSVFGLMVLSSCNSVAKKEPKKSLFEGRFVNQTFLDENNDSLDFSTPAYSFQLYFAGVDKVFVDRGFEGDTLTYAAENGNIFLQNASFHGDMTIVADADGQGLTLMDTAFTGKSIPSHYIRVDDLRDGIPVLTYLINDQMVAGNYQLLEKGSASGKKVQFLSNGKIEGLKGYRQYVLCYTGDCMQTTLPYHNIMTMTTDEGNAVTFAYVVGKEKKSLTIFAIEEPKQGIKGERRLKEPVFELISF